MNDDVYYILIFPAFLSKLQLIIVIYGNLEELKNIKTFIFTIQLKFVFLLHFILIKRIYVFRHIVIKSTFRTT